MAEQGGRFPDTYQDLRALPGVGDYTASAIASAAFGRREAAVDGNVLRVVMRLTDCRDDIADPKVNKAVRAQIQAVMPEAEADIRVCNQATMELGATVCAPNGPPRCLECPAMAFCKGRLRGTAEDLPVKGAKSPAGWRRRRCSCWCGTERSPCGSGRGPGCWRACGSFPTWREPWTRLPPERRCPSGAWSPGGGRAD
ncbi:MAG: hypothetical protein ACLTYN_17610 [Dysosmobacter welbionis]